VPAYDHQVIAERIEQRWLDTLVSLRQFSSFHSEGWRRTASAIDTRCGRLGGFKDLDALGREYIAVVLGRRVRVDDPSTQASPFVRDASFALRYVELKTGVHLSAAALPGWLGEWAVES
jgi:hypothetical protein